MKFHSQECPQELQKTLRMNVGVLISGSGTNLQSLIDHSLKLNSKAEIVLVISNVENAFGLERARKAGIPTKVGVSTHRFFETKISIIFFFHDRLAIHINILDDMQQEC